MLALKKKKKTKGKSLNKKKMVKETGISERKKEQWKDKKYR